MTIIGIVLIIFAISNNQIIEVRILPDNFVGVLGLKSTYSLPFFVILYPTLVLGLLLGFFFEYFRERKYRVKLKQANKDIKFLQNEKKKFRNSDGDSEILNLIDRD
ncbi:lipopolysaccharide assembly protein LapA domain-containing protein [Paracoccaceae bacterium]|nr:lipopolysaccharide assembly protein LapA domain-containing protein [Paracoccaceae bacterium]